MGTFEILSPSSPEDVTAGCRNEAGPDLRGIDQIFAAIEADDQGIEWVPTEYSRLRRIPGPG